MATDIGFRSPPSHHLEHFLHNPVALLILPAFALANTGMLAPGSLGIIAGLVIGKPLGITLDLSPRRVGPLAPSRGTPSGEETSASACSPGIGFTMSIFIASLAFPDRPRLVDASIVAILAGSLAAGAIGLAWLRFAAGPRQRP